MSKLHVYTVYDLKAEAYLRPFFSQNNGSAIRSLADSVNAKEAGNMVSQHPEDFSLFCIGEWDERTGLLVKYDGKHHLVDCIDLVYSSIPNTDDMLMNEQAG